MTEPLWRQNLQPASYNGVQFHVDVQAKASGRRIVQHEFPKKCALVRRHGRRIRKFTLNAYIIYSPVNNQDWESNRDDLIAQLEADGAGLLVLLTGLQSMVLTKRLEWLSSIPTP